MNEGGHRSPLTPEWDPLTTLVDGEPGEWFAGKGFDQPYAVIRLVEIGAERGYRVVTWAKRSEDRELVGYRKTLRGAASLAQRDRMNRVMRPLGRRDP
ncbi:hypothetical protein [Mesorhizobium japonicum]|uniref:hypothetical protein n=1 Tax=Mesorhizobium japonicum TaxID=2066070 RepID=UPI003B59C544